MPEGPQNTTNVYTEKQPDCHKIADIWAIKFMMWFRFNLHDCFKDAAIYSP